MKHLKTFVACLLACATISMVFAQKDTILPLPFTRVGNLIILEAEVHGIKGAFILDTGIPGVYLNDRYFRESSDVVNTDQVVGIHGRTRRVGLLQTDIRMAGIRQGIDALVVDLTHIEKAKGIPLLGLIGQAVFRRHELLFDLPHYSILLIPIDRKGDRIASFQKRPRPLPVSYKTKGHLPVINAQIDGMELFLGFDTGAECNVMEPKYRTELKIAPQWKKQANLASGWKSSQTVAYKIPGIKVFDQACPPMLTVFSTLSSINDQLFGPELDGIIGLEWLLHQPVSFNFRKNHCYLWTEQSGTKDRISVQKNQKQVNEGK